MRDVYTAQAAYWWDKNGPFKMLHRLHPTRFALIVSQVDDLSGKYVLDYACGGGFLAESLVQAGAEVVGLDINERCIEVAQAHAKQSGLCIDYRCGDIDSLISSYNKKKVFDMVCALECLEHVAYPRRMVESLASYLGPGGYAVFSTINRNIKSYLLGVIAAEYLLGWVEPGTHEHNRFIKPSELVEMCRNAGLQLYYLAGMCFDLKTQTFHRSDCVDVNYLAIFVKVR